MISDPPDRAATILGDEQRAVIGHCDADRATPYLGVGDHEAGHEILVFACGFAAAVEQQPHDFVSRPLVAVPGAVHGRKRTALVLGGKVVALVEDHLQGRRMGLHQHVGDRDLVLEIGPTARMPRIFVSTDEVPRPTIEGAFNDMCCIFKWRVVAELIALVDDAPELPGGRLNSHAYAIAQARRDDLQIPAVRVEGQDIRAQLFRVPGSTERLGLRPLRDTVDVARLWNHGPVRLGEHVQRNVRSGADREEQSLPIRREDDVTRIVMGRRNPFDDALRFRGGLEIAVSVAETDHTVAVGDIDPLRVRPEGIERDAKWLLQPAGKYRVFLWRGAARRNAQHMHRAEHAVGHEQITVRRDANHTRLVQTRCRHQLR